MQSSTDEGCWFDREKDDIGPCATQRTSRCRKTSTRVSLTLRDINKLPMSGKQTFCAGPGSFRSCVARELSSNSSVVLTRKQLNICTPCCLSCPSRSTPQEQLHSGHTAKTTPQANKVATLSRTISKQTANTVATRKLARLLGHSPPIKLELAGQILLAECPTSPLLKSCFTAARSVTRRIRRLLPALTSKSCCSVR